MTDEESFQTEIAQTEKCGLGDFALALLVGVATWFLQALWAFPEFYPGFWNDAVIGASVRPAAAVMPGYAIGFANIVFHFFGIDRGEQALQLIGRGVLVVTAVTSFVIIRETLTLVMRARPQLANRRALVVRLASAIGAFAFVCMDPVWTTGQCLTETSIKLLLTVLSLASYLLLLRKGSLIFAAIGSTLLGFLAAETPLGFLLPVLLIALYMFVLKRLPNLESPFFRPATLEVGKWQLTFLYFAALSLGIAANCFLYVSHGGLGAIGETLGSLPLAYVSGYWNIIVDAAGVTAWLMWIAICLTPFVVTLVRFPVAADEAHFLPYATGLIFVFCGTLAFSQAASLPALWFWTYFPVDSQYLLVLGLLCLALTLAGSLVTLGVDALCRDHQKLAEQLFGMEDGVLEAPKQSRIGRLLRRVSVLVLPLVIIALIVPGRAKVTTRLMLGIIGDSIREIVREAKGAKYLFTDGTLDAAIELEAAREGSRIYCLSLMGSSDPRAAYLRTRGLTADSEDAFSFGFDAGTGLRSWIRDKPNHLKDCAALMGFDLWKRDAKPLPPMGGFLSRPAGFASKEEQDRGITAAHDLADRFFAVYARRGGIKTCTDESIKSAFVAAQWRLARLCTYRSEAYDLSAQVESAISESTLAKNLNDRNPTYRDLLETMEKRNALLMQKLTPREGLQLALVRADFTLGKTYAETILGVDPNNPDANFSMGMYYLEKRQLSLAETYLKRCLIRKPNEPAVFNNLAMIQINQRKFDAAEINVRKALKLVPNSAAVLDTKKMLEKARAAAAPAKRK